MQEIRKIKYIVIHCTATTQNTTVSSIQRYWKERLGWKNPGYHFIITPEGKAVMLLDLNRIANGVKGYNQHAIHISYIGGVDSENYPTDNRTTAQKQAIRDLVKAFTLMFPKAEVLGHRDFPGVKKECPSFDVKTELINK